MEQINTAGPGASLKPPLFVAEGEGAELDDKPHRYRARAYGLDILSDIPLPEFMPAGCGGDVVVSLEPEDAGVACTAPAWDFRPAEVICSFPNVARFQLRAGREIRITPAPGADRSLIHLYVEGMMMAILLHQRNFFVLHASVIEVNGAGVGFLGHIGAGKSTTALALQRRGARLISDDNAAVEIVDGTCWVTPAFPRVKIYPAIAQTLGIADDGLTALHQSQVKKTRQIENDFPATPARLDRIYVLSRTASRAIEPLGRGESLIELITNSVPTRWGLPGGAEQMKKGAALTRLIPVFRVRTFQGLEEIEPLARTIEAHVSGK